MPKLIFITFIVLFVLLGANFFLDSQQSRMRSVPVKTISTDTAIPTIPTISADKLFSLVQDWRKDNNLQPYIKDEGLCKIAEQRSIEIQSDFSHAKFIERFKNSPYEISENISRGYTEQSTLIGWLHSPPHLAALKRPYTYSCIGCNNNYCSQIFSNL